MIQYANEPEMPEAVELLYKCLDNEKQLKFMTELKQLYTGIHEYMSNWTEWTKPLLSLSWTSLSRQIEWSEIIQSANDFKLNLDHSKLKSELDKVNLVISENPLDFLNDSTGEKWQELFRQEPNIEELGKLIEKVLSFPATNATCERSFSEIVFYWNKWRSSSSLPSVKSALDIRYNYVRKCQDFLQMLITDSQLRNSIRSQDKYSNASLDDDKTLTEIMNQMSVSESSDTDDDEDEEPLYIEFKKWTASNKKSDEVSDDSEEMYMYEPDGSKQDVALVDCTSEITQSEVDAIEVDAADLDEGNSYNNDVHGYHKRYETRSKW